MLHLRCPLDTQVEITEMQLVFEYPAQGCVETRDMKLGVTVMWLTEGESAYEEKRPQKRVFQPGEMEKERRKELKRRLKMSYLWIGREIQERAWSQKPEGERGREGLNWMLQETKVNTRDWPLPWVTWTSLESWAAVHSLFHQRQAFEIDLEEFGQVMVKGRKLGAMEGVWSQEVTWGCYCNPGQNDGDWWVAHPSIIETLCRLSDGCGLKISCWWEGGWWGRERKRQRWLGIFVAVCSLGYLIVFWVCLWYSFLS